MPPSRAQLAVAFALWRMPRTPGVSAGLVEARPPQDVHRQLLAESRSWNALKQRGSDPGFHARKGDLRGAASSPLQIRHRICGLNRSKSWPCPGARVSPPDPYQPDHAPIMRQSALRAGSWSDCSRLSFRGARVAESLAASASIRLLANCEGFATLLYFKKCS